MIRLPNYKNRAYLDWLKTQPCFVCGAPHSDPAHQSAGFSSGTGKKAPDSFALPLCRSCHNKENVGVVRFWRNFFEMGGDTHSFIIQCMVARICLLYFTTYLEEEQKLSGSKSTVCGRLAAGTIGTRNATGKSRCSTGDMSSTSTLGSARRSDNDKGKTRLT